MNRQNKPLKFYLYIFLFSTLIIVGYSVYQILANDATVSDVYTLWFMPPLFTLFYFGSDKIILKLSNRKKKVNYEAKFLDEISERMRQANEFLIEEFRRLQTNQKFQSDLKKAYTIYQDGESDLFNIEKLERKYKKDSLEKRAMKYVIAYLKENKNNPDTGEKN